MAHSGRGATEQSHGAVQACGGAQSKVLLRFQVGRPAAKKSGPQAASVGTLSARDQSALAPEAFTTWLHFALSARMKAANCSGFSL
jgi:hypothetical protein